MLHLRTLLTTTLVVLVCVAHTPGTMHAQPRAGTFVAGEILVKFRPGTPGHLRADAHRGAGGTVLAAIPRTGVERVAVMPGGEQSAIARYRRNPNVLIAEPNHLRNIPEPVSHAGGTEVVPGDHYFKELWGLHNTGQLFMCFPWIGGQLCFYVGTPDADIDAPEAWAMTTGSPHVRVAVIDSGIDYHHPDLAANYEGGADFFNGDGDPMDDHGHGTHVAGTIAAMMGNPTGSPSADEGVVGVAPNVRLLAYKVCGANGSCSDFAIQQAIAQAIADGALVVNMSLGSTVYSQSLDDAVQDAWRAGLVIVAGAGNNGTTERFYPAALDNVIAVGAFDEDHLRASFSNHGDWVHISAPGTVILSTYPLAACGGLGATPGDTGCYTWNSGTSMATPHVSGAAALVWSRGDVTSNQQVVDALLQSANRAGAGTVRLDTWTRHGGLNVHDALGHGVSNPNLPPIANAGPDHTVTDADGDGIELVTLDGSASHDPDGTIVGYEWREGSAVLGSDAMATLPFEVGTHEVTLVVTDDAGDTGSDTVIVTILPPPAAADTVAITKASYQNGRKQLSIEATSSASPGAVLVVHDTSNPASPVQIGPLEYNAKRNRYSGTFDWPTKPASVLVVSSEGGSAAAAIGGK